MAGREDEIAAVLGEYEWDVVLGSVHWVAGHAVDWDADSVWAHLPAGEVWEQYADTLCQAAVSGLYDVMAHPDLAKVFGHRPGARREELYERIAEAFAGAGVCAEVSTAGYHRELGELYPDPDLLARFRQRGVPVTLASDAHAPERIGRDFPRALDEVRRAGYTTLTRFDRRRPTQVAIDG
jgi:histidinol-phosphatase (PHP family)